MPAGCEFICQNKMCEHYNKGFNMTSNWPMGRIELIINAPNVKKSPSFRDGLIKLKNEGRKYACITYPNVSQIKTEAYRVQLWSNDAHCLWQYDIESDEETNLSDLINQEKLPKVCPKTGGEMWTFDQTTKNGIICPHCGVTMRQDRWFTNEE